MFLATMKPKALAKWQQHPGLFDRERLAAARTLYEFDDVFTAPLHGFRDTPDYWQRASAKPHLARIRIPALVLNAAQRPLRAGGFAAARAGAAGPLRHAVATGAGRPRGLSARRLSRPRAGHAAGGGRLAGRARLTGAKLRAMDDIVKAALAKWPHVPHCYGWLALDARGDWYMRDDRIQAAGPFPRVKGSRIAHDKLLAFIHRNYAHDERGAWFFQNGPQRVYVELEAAPYVWRVDAAPGWPVTAHTGPAGRGAQQLARRTAAACSWTPTSASASCTRWTWASRRRRWTAAPGRLASCRSPRCPRASAMRCGRKKKPPRGRLGAAGEARLKLSSARWRPSRSGRRLRLVELAAALVDHVDHGATDLVVKETKVFKVYKDCLELQGNKDQKETKELQEHKDQREKMVEY